MFLSLSAKNHGFQIQFLKSLQKFRPIECERSQDGGVSRAAEISSKAIYIFENTTNTTIPEKEIRGHRTAARLHLHL